MSDIAHRALVVWGICHMLRMPDDAKDEATRRKKRIEHRKQDLVRERDALIEAFSKFQSAGKRRRLTEASAARVKRIEQKFKSELSHTQDCGFGQGPGRPDFYPRPLTDSGAHDKYPKGPNPNRLDSVQAMTFQIIESYLSKRPMQRALAWRVYVDGKGAGGFRYIEKMGESEHTFCGSRTAAYRMLDRFKGKVETLVSCAFDNSSHLFSESFEPKKAS